jgi:hypothetical protein
MKLDDVLPEATKAVKQAQVKELQKKSKELLKKINRSK